MKIANTRVHGLEESIIASRYPMMIETPEEDVFQGLDEGLQTITMSDCNLKELQSIYNNSFEDEIEYLDRAKNLGKARQGSGHNNALKGIIVQADITASQAWWLQQGRYHFSDIVSSQSKMYRLTLMDIDKQCNKYVSKENIRELEHWIKIYNNFEQVVIPMKKHGLELRNGEVIEFTKENLFQVIINNCPMGLELTARITDNYLSIKTQYEQREGHKLYEWQEWSKWAEELPYFKELTGIKIKGECE